jgi:hypothetical protein
MRYFLVLPLVLAEQVSSLEDSRVTVQFMVSRSVVLYLLSVWFMFMIITHFHGKAIENCTILESKVSLQADNELNAGPHPSAPSYAPSFNTQPLLSSRHQYLDRPTAPSYIPSIRDNPFLGVIEE